MKEVYFGSFKITTTTNYSYPSDMLVEVQRLTSYEQIDALRKSMIKKVEETFKKNYPNIEIAKVVTLNFNLIKTVR